MKNVIMILFVMLNSSFGYLEINDVVGKVIDAREAQYYRIFTDVPGFESARFVDNGDSILIEINVVIKDDHETEYKNIDNKAYKSLDRYIKYFKRIIEDEKYRQRYIGEHAIGWPIISQREINEITRNLNDKIKLNNLNCMSSIASGSAYAGALLGRQVTDISYGCITTYYYSINPFIFIGTTAAGTMYSLLVMPRADTNKVVDEALKKDVLAFDLYQKPIIVRDFIKEKNNAGQCIYGGAGFLAGLVASTATLALMSAPYLFYSPNSQWDMVATVVPMVVFSVSELATITRFFTNEGRRHDRKTALEKIKQKRIKDHLKSQKAEDQ